MARKWFATGTHVTTIDPTLVLLTLHYLTHFETIENWLWHKSIRTKLEYQQFFWLIESDDSDSDLAILFISQKLTLDLVSKNKIEMAGFL